MAMESVSLRSPMVPLRRVDRLPWQVIFALDAAHEAVGRSWRESWITARPTSRSYSRIVSEPEPVPLLAAVADALRRCGRGRWDRPSYATDARATLDKLADTCDGRVRDAVLSALRGLDGVA